MEELFFDLLLSVELLFLNVRILVEKSYHVVIFVKLSVIMEIVSVMRKFRLHVDVEKSKYKLYVGDKLCV